MKKAMLMLLISILLLIAISYTLLYFYQEKLIFIPTKLNKDYSFQFEQKYEELSITAPDGINLHGLLFKADSSKGVIYYLHGNAGALDSWGEMAKLYTDLKYDLFILDYRGYGKSEGSINSQEQFYTDAQTAYDTIKNRYAEKNIIVLGYSIGTWPATKIAATNTPKLLILQAPYYSLVDYTQEKFPYVPTLILKYKFETNKIINDCKMPIILFHGDSDEVFPVNNALRLKEHFKDEDALYILKGQGHNGITYNADYLEILTKKLRLE